MKNFKIDSLCKNYIYVYMYKICDLKIYKELPIKLYCCTIYHCVNLENNGFFNLKGTYVFKFSGNKVALL